ncbi:MAG: hypothetical protein ACYCW6_09540, partial [Candidatus Xenobia bacterium]
MFLIGEIVLTLADPWLFRDAAYQYDDSDFGYRVRPGALGSNQYGFNDSDHPLQKAPGTYRAMFLADSYNWAGGRTASYTADLQTTFNKDFGTGKIEVMNAGYPGTHT